MAVMGAASALFFVCCVLPAGYLLGRLLIGGDATPTTAWLDVRQRGLLYNTTVLGLGTALLGTAIGAPLGVALARIPLRRPALVRLALATPLLLPPYVVALAWTYVGGSRGLLATLIGRDLVGAWTFSLPAAILVLGLVFYPLAMVATEVAVRRVDGRLEEAAVLVAPPGRVLWHITLPLAAPSVLAAALVIFVLAISEFGVPGLLRVRVYTTEVLTAFAALYDFNRALILSAPLLLLGLVVGILAAVLLRERLVTGRRTIGAQSTLLNEWRRPAAAGAALALLLAVVAPVAILLREAMGTDSWSAVLSGSSDAILNSLILAASGATAVVGLALWLGYARARARSVLGPITDILFIVVFALPSTIVGVGLIGLWNRPGPLGVVYGTDFMFLLAYLARFVPVVALILGASIRSVSVSHEEAAAVSGAGWWRTMARILLPQIRLAVAAAWVIAFVLAFGELGVSILIAPPGEATLPIRIYTLIANTSPSTVAALALLQTAIVLAPLFVLGGLLASGEAR